MDLLTADVVHGVEHAAWWFHPLAGVFVRRPEAGRPDGLMTGHHVPRDSLYGSRGLRQCPWGVRAARLLGDDGCVGWSAQRAAKNSDVNLLASLHTSLKQPASRYITSSFHWKRVSSSSSDFGLLSVE